MLRLPTSSAISLLGYGTFALCAPIPPAHAGQPLLLPNSLVISSTTYDPTQGAVASLMVGSPLPGPSVAVSGNNYVTVWNNATVDGSFGITSPITLTVINPNSGRVFSTVTVPADQVVTSFSSKSELGLHIARSSPGANGANLIFVGYASPGVGALDISNADAVPGQDPTNPVTAFFGLTYAASRTIVNVDSRGKFSYTPTINYGGNNGRSALLAPNGLYYSVGNANNGNAATFGDPACTNPALTTSTLNCTNPDVTMTTGLIAVTPINAATANASIPSGNSAQVDPTLQFDCGKNGAADKAGKDNNYRGITEYGGALYFTKGSGSNGKNTVYTVSSLPSLAGAASTPISIVPGFPTDCARESGGDYTPFAVFFANPTTMYVTDEGSGNALDASMHAGLEKWSLVNGSWQFDYVLTNGLIGVVDTNLNGPAGQYPDTTTVGLRNLSARLNGNGTVTLWATTSTSSASGDNGADPNKLVEITDVVAATTLTGEVATEAFTTVFGPTYGTVYRGVAYVGN